MCVKVEVRLSRSASALEYQFAIYNAHRYRVAYPALEVLSIYMRISQYTTLIVYCSKDSPYDARNPTTWASRRRPRIGLVRGQSTLTARMLYNGDGPDFIF